MTDSRTMGPLRREESAADPIAHLLALLDALGSGRYGGEEVTQLAHALQCATFAQQSCASDSLVAAALLHDIGHLVNPKDENATLRGVDAAPEPVGAASQIGSASCSARVCQDVLISVVAVSLQTTKYNKDDME